VRNAGDLVTVIAPDGTVSYQSPSVDALLGRSPEEVVGRPFEELVERSDHPLLQRLLAEDGGRDDGRRPPLECSLLHRDGRSLTFEILHANLLDDEHVGGIVLTCRDVSARRALEEQLAHQAFHDPLTKLANRAFFAERVRHALARARRERSGIAVAFLDLDDFKAINDTLGHGAGDEVLLEVAKRLASSIRTSDTASRFGGDEFALLLEDIDDVQDAADVAQRVLAALAMPMHVGHTELTVRSSMGLALADGAGDADELVHDADAAMYVAKRDGKGAYRIFEAAMQEGAMSRLELSADLEGAIAAGRLELHYQPIVRLGDGATVAVEALLRWHHPERGEIPPGEFIPLAEETGLIVPIGRWALREACRQARRMLDALPSGGAPALSVNLSLKQVLHRTLVSDVRETLLDLRLDPAALTLEITEAALMADADAAARRLGELRDLGVRIALDDFGAGWSSLSHLGRFPLDVLKLDRSLLRSGEPEGAGLAAALVAVGGALGLEVVAEGIEADDERERLADAGCPLGQGFLFARPMDGDETLAHVLSRHPDAS
jgi:diguanylate cyclase (GGDEF)-like protein/PAS domain S-box-containing protein